MSASRPLKYRVTQIAGLLLTLIPGTALAERLPLKPYTTADGLPHNAINKIVRDSRGFLWFCTDDGLSRYDGYAFTNYGTDQGLSHAAVNDFLETRSGELWVATNGGLVLFNPKGATNARVAFANFPTEGGPRMFTVVVPDDSDRRAKAVTVLIEGRDGTIWCGTLKGLFRLERSGGRLELRPVDIGIPNEYPEQRFISDVIEDRYGSLWIAAPSGLYRRWPDGSAARYFAEERYSASFFQDLLIDHREQLWVATRSAGFFRLAADETDAPPVTKERYTAPDGLTTNWVFQLFETSDRHFWIATNKGLIAFSSAAGDEGHQFNVYSKTHGLSFQEVTALNEDTSGNIWLGTNVAGAMKLARNGFVTYDEQDGVVGVYSLFGDRAGGVCFRGSVLGNERASIFDGGKVDLLNLSQATYWPRLGRFDGQRFTWFSPDVFRSDSYGWVAEGVTMQARNGEWWISAYEGLYRFPAADNFTHIKHARPLSFFTHENGRVYRLFEDSSDRIWISTINPPGLAVWERANLSMRDQTGAANLPSFKDDNSQSDLHRAEHRLSVGQ